MLDVETVWLQVVGRIHNGELHEAEPQLTALRQRATEASERLDQCVPPTVIPTGDGVFDTAVKDIGTGRWVLYTTVGRLLYIDSTADGPSVLKWGKRFQIIIAAATAMELAAEWYQFRVRRARRQATRVTKKLRRDFNSEGFVENRRF